MSDAIHREYHAGGALRVEHGLDAEGQPHGAFASFFEDGSPRKRGTYEHGQQHGEWRTWHPTGQLAAIAHYQHGSKCGEWRSWYPDGVLKAIRFFEDDREHGRRTVWYRDRHWVEDFVEGKKHGLWQEWRGERLMRQGEYFEGLEHGQWVDYDDAGGVSEIRYYRMGRRVRNGRA